MPQVVMNDRDVKFTLEFWTLLMKKVGMKLASPPIRKPMGKHKG
jgi:hypothetical protein